MRGVPIGTRGLLALTLAVTLAVTLLGAAAPMPEHKPETPVKAAPDAAWARVTTPAPGQARVIGGYTRGCIAGAVSLPLDGPGYTVLRPQRLRTFGHPLLIQVVQDLGAWTDAHGWGTLLVGDLSQPRGGPMSYGHASHEAGLDADIWLRLLPPGQRLTEAERRAPTAVSYVRAGAGTADPALWRPAHDALVRAAALDPRVSRLFVNPAIKASLCAAFPPDQDGNAAWLRKVRPWYGHDSHMHIRLHCPLDSPACRPQKPTPPGAGCDTETFVWWSEETARWLAEKARRAAIGGNSASPSVARTPQPLPDACQAILIAR
ncbi:penicillin-insensitive murein endopeptidase [Roseospira visakhapatnamensis]|uniref:Penicillin-insensitive murein endopeptidase n=1 Tax=Roseospira visakhapatnamensis TaxID=390880 RepID=A0A7W6W9D6_9PROT|nr:penicillin-insensitive murein endopeptidase [Roseospira visakhapatnamensis]MBB4265713.1 penicillin-insensitive murein endopeptidase [Roseospira visakhapatnamensis]